MRAGRPLILPDVAGDPYLAGFFTSPNGPHSLAGIPLQSADRVTGVLGVLGTPDSELAGGTSTLVVLGQWLGLALDNRRLRRELRRQVARQAQAHRAEQKQRRIADTLRRVSHIVESGLNLGQVLDQILEQLAEVIEYDSCTIMLLQDDTLQVMAARGFPDVEQVKRLSFRLGENMRLHRVVEERRPLVFGDDHRPGPFESVSGPTELCSCLDVPLLVKDRLIGLLTVGHTQAGRYSEDDAQTVLAFANHAAIAIENARLYDEARRRTVQLETASQVSQKVASILDLDDLLREVVELIRDNFGYDHVQVFLVDDTADYIVLRDGSGLPPNYLRQGVRFKIGQEGITGWVAGSGQPILANDIRRDPRYSFHELLPQTMAEIAVPLKVGREVVGVLDVQSERLNAFSQEDVTNLQTLGDQIAVAIVKANLFRETKQRLEAIVKERTRRLEEAQEELAQKAAQLQWLLAETFNVQEEERARIAHDMHDGLSQLLIGALYEAQAAKQGLPTKPGLALEKIQAVQNLLKQMETEIRRIIHDLRPIILDSMGLIPALRQHAEAFSELFDIPCSVHVSGKPLRLMPTAETAIYRIVQEAMHNIRTHSTATMVQIYVLFKPTKIRVVVRDNGQGFDYESMEKDTTGHLGLVGMKERALSVGGTLEVDSSSRHGTRIIFQAPMHAVCQDGECPPAKTSWWENLLGFWWKR